MSRPRFVSFELRKEIVADMAKPNERAVQRRWDWDIPIIVGLRIYCGIRRGSANIDGSGGSSVVTALRTWRQRGPAAMAKQMEELLLLPGARLQPTPTAGSWADLLGPRSRRTLKNPCKTWMAVPERCHGRRRLACPSVLGRARPDLPAHDHRSLASFPRDNIFCGGLCPPTARRRMFTRCCADMPRSLPLSAIAVL